MRQKFFSLNFLIIFLVLSTTSWGKKPELYLTKTMEKATQEGKYVLLHFYADWCPSCQAQKKILDKIMVTDNALKGVVTLVIPYDDALLLRKEWNVNRQSTLIILKAGKELAREAGQTEKSQILSFLKTHISGD
ncbi:MAG: thioredoxin family protein [Proteobacteria bacterium]|nr:thioredoxin family protein [Pseudomonadota bacterium]